MKYLNILIVVSLGSGVLASPALAYDHWRGYGYGRGYYHRPRVATTIVFGEPLCDYPRRYVVVPAPIIVAAPTPVVVPATLQTIVVNVPNRNGSYTPVTLQAASNGTYIGPKGEVYPTQPTMEQLKEMYGK